MKVFITGGVGFIGGHLSDFFAKRGESVYIYDNFSRDTTKYFSTKPADIFVGDILDKDCLAGILAEIYPDLVIHCAAIAGVDCVSKDRRKTIETDFIGTYNLLTAMDNIGLDELIYFSSSEVYGKSSSLQSENEFLSIGPAGEKRWCYAMSKLASEHLIASYENISSKIIRPFNIYGPRQVGDGAIKIFIEKILNEEEVIIYNDGEEERSWCYILDFISAFSKIAEQEVDFEIYNVGNPNEEISTMDLILKIEDVVGKPAKIRYEKMDSYGRSEI